MEVQLLIAAIVIIATMLVAVNITLNGMLSELRTMRKQQATRLDMDLRAWVKGGDRL